MNVMVTGFGRFLDNEVNPTKEILSLLPKSIDGHTLTKVELPVIFDECFTMLKDYIGRHKADVIIMLGLAGGRTAITPERVAINLKDTNVADNVGNIPKEEPIVVGGPTTYFSTLPLRKIENRLNDKNIPVTISNSAGLYVCNNIFYHVMHCLAQHKTSTIAGFIHVPYMDEQAKPEGAFSLPKQIILEAVMESIKAIIE